MNLKTLLASFLAFSVAVPALVAAEAETDAASCSCNCKNCEMKSPPPGEGEGEAGRGSGERQRARQQQRGPRGQGEWQKGRPGGSEFFASRKEMMELMKAYRTNPTEENKAKLKARMEADYDAMVKVQEERLNGMKQKKDEVIKERLEKMTQRKDKGEKAGKGQKEKK